MEIRRYRHVVDVELPAGVLAALVDGEDVVLVDLVSTPIVGSSGAATGNLTRLAGRLRVGADKVRSFSLVRKLVTPLTAGRHAVAATDPSHWAHWQREALAYESGLLPSGPGLAAPRCLGVKANAIYLEDVRGQAQEPAHAARHLALWQSTTVVPQAAWLCTDQLAQRLKTTELDWTEVDADPRAVEMWDLRWRWMDTLSTLPRVLSHGDYSLET